MPASKLIILDLIFNFIALSIFLVVCFTVLTEDFDMMSAKKHTVIVDHVNITKSFTCQVTECICIKAKLGDKCLDMKQSWENRTFTYETNVGDFTLECYEHNIDECKYDDYYDQCKIECKLNYQIDIDFIGENLFMSDYFVISRNIQKFHDKYQTGNRVDIYISNTNKIYYFLYVNSNLSKGFIIFLTIWCFYHAIFMIIDIILLFLSLDETCLINIYLKIIYPIAFVLFRVLPQVILWSITLMSNQEDLTVGFSILSSIYMFSITVAMIWYACTVIPKISKCEKLEVKE